MSQFKSAARPVLTSRRPDVAPFPFGIRRGKASAAPAQANRPCLVSRSFTIVAESSCLPVECLLSVRSSSAVSAAWTASIAWTAFALRLSDTSGTTFCGRMRFWGSRRTTRPFSPMAGLEV